MRTRAAIPTASTILALLLGMKMTALAAAEPAAGPGSAPGNIPDSTLPPGPNFRDVISVSTVNTPRIAPDGHAIAYSVRSVDWPANRYDTEIWVAPREGKAFQLTHTEGGSSENPQWSADGKWITFIANRGKGPQLQIVSATGGEPQPLTALKSGIADYRWSPNGRHIALLLPQPPLAEMQRSERLGEFSIEEYDQHWVHLWLLDVAAARATAGGAPDASPALRQLTSGTQFTVGSFMGESLAFSPDGRRIAFVHIHDSTVRSILNSDISLVDTETGKITALVTRPSYDDSPSFSPDGRWLLFTTLNPGQTLGNNVRLAKISVDGGEAQILPLELDEQPIYPRWTRAGILLLTNIGTTQTLTQLDPATGKLTTRVATPNAINDYSVSTDGHEIALLGHSGTTMHEIYRVATKSWKQEKVTDQTSQLAAWPKHTAETIRWKSFDGTEIEGVLYKPAGFMPGKRYPLLVQMHGGPVYAEKPRRLHNFEYPIEQYLARGALVLMPNFRGSNGYGEKFRLLGTRDEGIGASKDVLAGVDTLIARGIADPDRLGAFGQSYGGYLAAFLLVTTDRFKAISDAAGITDMMLHYSTTPSYVGLHMDYRATPWEDPEIYAKTSPITYIRNAKTPTLIQHGENDTNVSPVNATMLFRALKDQGVETRLIILHGTGHNFSSPKAKLASQMQNWHWMGKYVWGDKAPAEYE